MDNIARLMAMYDEDGLSRPDTDPCLLPSTSVCIATESPGSGTIDREELQALLQDLCDPRAHAYAHDVCHVRTEGARCFTSVFPAEISLVQTQKWNVGLRKWITTAGGSGLSAKLNMRYDFAHPLPRTIVKKCYSQWRDRRGGALPRLPARYCGNDARAR